MTVIFLAYKGIKRAHKTYKKRKAEKEAQAKGEAVVVADPSEEIESRSGVSNSTTVQRRNSAASTSSSSTGSADEALKNDPDFREYMETHKALYLSQRRRNPPSYDAVVNSDMQRRLEETVSPSDSYGPHSATTEQRPQSVVQSTPTELSASHVYPSELDADTSQVEAIAELPTERSTKTPSSGRDAIAELPA